LGILLGADDKAVSPVGVLVSGPAHLVNQGFVKFTQQETAALVRVGFFSVGVYLFEFGVGDFHGAIFDPFLQSNEPKLHPPG
jgi:hypothetical protein